MAQPPYEAKSWKIVKPGFSRYDILLQGNSLAGLNPIPAGRRIRLEGALDGYVVLVELGQP